MLYIVRHGQSIWNAENRFTGWKDIELNEKGIEEAKKVGKLIKKHNIQIDNIYTSDLIRTKQTAHYIQEKLVQETLTCNNSQLLNERNYGDFSGLNKNEVKIEKGADFLHKLRRSYDFRPINGESLDDVVKRVKEFVDLYLENINHENTLLVAHGNSLRALFVVLGFKNQDNIEHFEIPTGQLIKIDIIQKKYSYINPYQFNGRQILDSRGNPTIEVVCKNIDGEIVGRGSSPSGASCGSKEAYELRDDDKTIFKGKSVLKALEKVKVINEQIQIKDELLNLNELDKQLIKIDNSTNKHCIGGNTTTAFSFCLLDLITNVEKREKYEYIQQLVKNKKPLFIPTPLANVLNGGKHGSGGLQIQEFMIFVNESYHIDKQVQILYNVFVELKKCLLSSYGKQSTNFGDEGGYVPCGIKTNYEALNVLLQAITQAGFTPNKDVFCALDCAASEFYNKETKLYQIEEKLNISGSELIEYYQVMVSLYPFIKSIEDPFDEDDYECWAKFNELVGEKINIVGDDLFCSNIKFVNEGLEKKWANSLLLKVNQIGTVSEAIESAQAMLKDNKKVIVSHRSGETNHAFIIDLAVGLGAQYVKIGGLCRGERIEKYNRLLEIHDYLT